MDKSPNCWRASTFESRTVCHFRMLAMSSALSPCTYLVMSSAKPTPVMPAILPKPQKLQKEAANDLLPSRVSNLSG